MGRSGIIVIFSPSNLWGAFQFFNRRSMCLWKPSRSLAMKVEGGWWFYDLDGCGCFWFPSIDWHKPLGPHVGYFFRACYFFTWRFFLLGVDRSIWHTEIPSLIPQTLGMIFGTIIYYLYRYHINHHMTTIPFYHIILLDRFTPWTNNDWCHL